MTLNARYLVRVGTHFLLALTALSTRADAQGSPAVPSDLVPDGHVAYLSLRATGTQNYLCLPSAGGPAWTLFGPQATLFDDGAHQEATHFLSANPDEAGVARATWQHSRDSSSVWARSIAVSTDANYVAPGAIPWLLLEVVGRREHPRDSARLAATTRIQRINTLGGVAPSAGCDAGSIGARVLVPYAADYVFFRSANGGQP
jgi:hypothetical protein